MELNFIPTLNNLSNLECLVIAENEIKNLKFLKGNLLSEIQDCLEYI